MNKTFADWKKYIQDIDSIVKSTHKVNGEHRLIGNKFVMAYQENSLFSLGMCVQNDQKEVRILIASEGEEALFRNCFEPNKVEGLMHIHGNIEIGYVVEGSAYQKYFGKEYHFKQGDFWIVDRNCYHSDIYKADNLFSVFISIPSRAFDKVLRDSIEDKALKNFIDRAVEDDTKIKQLIRFSREQESDTLNQMISEWVCHLMTEDPHQYQTSKAWLGRVLKALSIHYMSEESSCSTRKINDLVFHDIDQYMQKHYEHITIADLSERFHYNQDYFNRIIKEYTQLTYKGYLQKIRLEKAAELLTTTELSAQAISKEVGYESKGHFYKLFAEKFGMTPQEYRESV